MPKWMRVVRGMVGTGLTFGVGVGVIGVIVGLIALAFGAVSGREVLEIVGKASVVSFIVGVAFSGVLAISARGKTFEKLSLRLVTALGAGVGLLYFLLISINGIHAWSPADAIANFTILTMLGGGLAGGTLLLARRPGNSLESADVSQLGEGSMDAPIARSESKQKSRR